MCANNFTFLAASPLARELYKREPARRLISQWKLSTFDVTFSPRHPGGGVEVPGMGWHGQTRYQSRGTH